MSETWCVSSKVSLATNAHLWQYRAYERSWNTRKYARNMSLYIINLIQRYDDANEWEGEGSNSSVGHRWCHNRNGSVGFRAQSLDGGSFHGPTSPTPPFRLERNREKLRHFPKIAAQKKKKKKNTARTNFSLMSNWRRTIFSLKKMTFLSHKWQLCLREISFYKYKRCRK